ncbi:MAG: hypothetical protein R6V57_13845 [Vicinamibacterales bacterium]
MLLCASIAGYTTAAAPTEAPPGQLAGRFGTPPDIARFTAALEKKGFAVQNGQLARMDFVSLCCSSQIPTCECNNAGAPYKMVQVPDAPGQAETGSPLLFRLAANEAIVIVGRTPPPMSYFSVQSFLAWRWGERQQNWGGLLGPLGDTLNNLTIRTSGPASDPFDKDTIVILTADRRVNEQVQAAARQAGYPASIFNTVVVPSSLARLGNEEHSDCFNFTQRMFRPLPGHEDAFKKYLDAPQVALRVTLTGAAPDPLPAPRLRVRGTGWTEMDLMPAVEALREAILARHSTVKSEEPTTQVWLTDGYDGLQRGVDQWGPSRDTVYLRTIPEFRLGPNDFVIVYGANHEATGKAAYSNAGVYAGHDIRGEELLLGLVSEQSGNFRGSARDYQSDAPDTLYAWKFARNCGGEAHCTPITTTCARLDLDNHPPDMWMGFRAYLEPSTAVGPAFTELIYDRAIVFRGQ